MDDERTRLEEELAHHKHNLLLLRQQKVACAASEEPLHLLNQIKAEEQAIRSIEQRLAELTELTISPTTPSSGAPIPGKKLCLGDWLARALRDPIWQCVGVVIAIIAVLAGSDKGGSLLRPTPTPTPTPTPAPMSAPTSIPGREIPIPAGYFLMGSDDEYPDARPQRQVYVEAFWIGKYEVSNEEYKQFIDATGHGVPYVEADWTDPYDWDPVTRAYPAGKARYPVVLVSWHDAQAYCRWAGKRLPTEAEWEKAARGTDGRRYPWGDEWDRTKANSFECGRGEASPVGMYDEGASPYGVLDMAGNVWEWTASKYEPYPGSSYWTETFRRDRRVLRGGSWRETGKVEEKIHPDGPVSVSYGSVTTAFRCAAVPDDRLDDVGFRCARSAATR